MAITRRQFVTRLGALAAAAGFSQADVARIAEAFAYGNPGLGGTFGKPRVVWIHGAECTGCSTSLLGLFENKNGLAVDTSLGGPIDGVTTAAGLGLAGVFPTAPLGVNDFTLHAAGYNVEGYADAVNIADVVVDVIDLLYHETVMGMGGDLGYQWLADFMATNNKPFVLVVEGALQDKLGGGAWNDVSDTDVPWCSIGMSDDTLHEHDMPHVVQELAEQADCLAVVAIGQCATFGGYPGCKPPITAEQAGGFDPNQSQTGAMGTYDYLVAKGSGAAAKVVNCPGCPTNPWWFVLTVVCFLVDYVNGPAAAADGPLGILDSTGAIVGGVDSTRRLNAVYSVPIHNANCPRYIHYRNNNFAAKPGDPGCLQKIGCKGMATNSLCGAHGWNNQQPENPDAWNHGVPGLDSKGGHCTRAGHPCMACTEAGYPDAYVPFIKRS